MAPPLLHLQNIALTFGGTPLLEQADLSVSAGERLCLVGRNGSGKSTLLKIAAGLIEPSDGTRFLQPGTTLRYLPQEPDFTGFSTTLAYVEAGLNPGDDEYRARMLLEDLGLTGDEDPARLSGGEARRAALARVMAPEPDILLIDEPTNHLDLPAIEWLESELKSLRSAIVLISHDRRFLENLSRATVWIDRGKTRRLDRGFSHFEAWRDEVLEQEERDRHKLDRKIADEEHWLRYGVTARRKRNVRRLEQLGSLRTDYRDHRKSVGDVKMVVTEGGTSGKLVAEAKNITKSWGDQTVVRDFSIRVARGDRLGLIGPNGAGKTTMINLLTGVVAPDKGSVRLGASIELAGMDQKRASLDPSWTLREALTGGSGDTVFVGGQTKHVISYMKDFLFQPEQAGSPISRLSGGERGRLQLARALAQPSNLLVLDEPTNDLDLETLDLLQEMVSDYPGTVILVSHDRDFLDRTVTSVVVAEGDGLWVEYAGGYADMLAQRGKGVEAKVRKDAAAEPAMRASAPAQPPRQVSRKKMSFKQQHLLDTAPARIAAMEAEIARLRGVLADPALYTRDPVGFAKAGDALAKAEADLSKAEDEWLELEALRDEMASDPA
ncbi:ABC-F family ATP-binding cassette domain-containing protein [Terrihabitans rhizophilus]|uniref:ATP-binding cassette domain-containing protein n=1 Tax=Terrihabitans rhizophilus TaxID=3092662 RepID=A0ABU4RL48_9HYPH|nr:ATP-binding cassette domain-containing protein [Terrihabitans sp. PJ23]MDX6805301.1 ATP-binding cassette domain-containing protein [Terrihabitans sp. PJ23]